MKKLLFTVSLAIAAFTLSGQNYLPTSALELSGGPLSTFMRKPPFEQPVFLCDFCPPQSVRQDFAAGWQLAGIIHKQLYKRHFLLLGAQLSRMSYKNTEFIGTIIFNEYREDWSFLGLVLGHGFYFVGDGTINVTMTNAVLYEFPVNNYMQELRFSALSYLGKLGLEFNISRKFAVRTNGVFRTALSPYEHKDLSANGNTYLPFGYGIEVGLFFKMMPGPAFY